MGREKNPPGHRSSIDAQGDFLSTHEMGREKNPPGHRSKIGAPRFFIRSEMALPKMACHFRQSHLSSTFHVFLKFFYRPIHGSIKKRGAPIFDRCPKGFFYRSSIG